MAKQTITGLFQTRREAELAVEHLVQDNGLDRSCVEVRAAGEENTSGTKASGADAAIRHRGSDAPGDTPGDIVLPEGEREAHADSARNGGILVSAEVEEADLDRMRTALRDFGKVVEDPKR
jgi:hypothetical protein